MNEFEAVEEMIEQEREWCNGSVMLYHVTPGFNLGSIELCGIDPTLATGRMAASWYVSKGGIIWALAHCSARHKVAVNDLIVCTVMLPRLEVKRTALPFMFYVRRRYAIACATPSEFYLSNGGYRNE